MATAFQFEVGAEVEIDGKIEDGCTGTLFSPPVEFTFNPTRDIASEQLNMRSGSSLIVVTSYGIVEVCVGYAQHPYAGMRFSRCAGRFSNGVIPMNRHYSIRERLHIK